MSTEVIDIICHMNIRDLESQLALQCAPMIVGMKMSNLFVTEPRSIRALRSLLKGSGISLYVLTSTRNKVTLFLFQDKWLTSHVLGEKEQALLKRLGYREGLGLTGLMLEFRRRYAAYLRGETEFPHEMGVFLGYPIEDVEGFIDNKGNNFLYSGYWKVYENVDEKKEIFELYEIAKETLVRLLAGGVSITEIIDTYCSSDTDVCGVFKNRRKIA